MASELFRKINVEKNQYNVLQLNVTLCTLIYATSTTPDFDKLIDYLAKRFKKHKYKIKKIIEDAISGFSSISNLDLHDLSLDDLECLGKSVFIDDIEEGLFEEEDEDEDSEESIQESSVTKNKELKTINRVINQKERGVLMSRKIYLTKKVFASTSKELLDNEDLKGYNYIKKKFLDRTKGNQYCLKLLELSKAFIEQFYTQSYQEIKSELKKLEPKIGQFSLDRFIDGNNQGYLAFSNRLWKNRFAMGITHILYQFKCRIKPFDDKSYFGYTDDLDRRIEEHTIEALAPRGVREEGHMHISLTKLHKAIREAFTLNSKYGRFFSEGGTFEDIYDDLLNIKGTKKYNIKMYYIREDIIKSYFDILKVEMTRGIIFARDRERFYTKSYENDDGSIGTVKNGLNERHGGGGRGISGIFYKFPWLDVAGMLSIGLSYISITEIMKEQYKNLEHINEREVSRQIKNMWGEQYRVYMKFLLPVLEELLKCDISLTKKDILEILGWSNNKFDRYFGSISLLKKMIEESGSLNRNRIIEFIQAHNQDLAELTIQERKLKSLLRGKSIEQWKTWAMEETPLREIEKILDCSDETIRSTYKKISHLLVGVENLSLSEIRRILHKKKAIKLLRKGINPKKIVIENFGRVSYKKCGIKEFRKFYERLFEENGIQTMTYDVIIEAFYNKQ